MKLDAYDSHELSQLKDDFAKEYADLKAKGLKLDQIGRASCRERV